MKHQNLIKIGIRFFWFLFFGGLIITSSIIVENNMNDPYLYTDSSFNWKYTSNQINWTQYNIALDQHSHTLVRGGKLTVRQNILWHIAHGFNAMVLTDHNSLSNAEERAVLAEEYKSQIIVLQGMEYTTDRIHMCFLGIKSWNLTIPDEPTDAELQAAIKEVHAQGGLCTVNHPYRSYLSKPTHPTRDQLVTWGVDYIELVNGNEIDNISLGWINSTGFGEISGTDMHEPKTVNAWTALNATNFTADAIMNELRAKRTHVYYDAVGSPDKSVKVDSPLYQILEPMILLGQLFKIYAPGNDLDWVGIGVFGLYLLAVFIIAEIIRYGNQKFWETHSKKNKSDEPAPK